VRDATIDFSCAAVAVSTPGKRDGKVSTRRRESNVAAMGFRVSQRN
jgi:hypothetical protein